MNKEQEDYYMNLIIDEIEVMQLKYGSKGFRPILQQIWKDAQKNGE